MSNYVRITLLFYISQKCKTFSSPFCDSLCATKTLHAYSFTRPCNNLIHTTTLYLLLFLLLFTIFYLFYLYTISACMRVRVRMHSYKPSKPLKPLFIPRVFSGITFTSGWETTPHPLHPPTNKAVIIPNQPRPHHHCKDGRFIYI